DDALNTLMVGVPNHGYDADGADIIAKAGAALMFLKCEDGWLQSHKLIGGKLNREVERDDSRLEAGDMFGNSVAFTATTLLIGAPYHQYDQNGRNPITGAGVVFVFDREAPTDMWVQRQKIVARGQERDPNTTTGRALAGHSN